MVLLHKVYRLDGNERNRNFYRCLRIDSSAIQRTEDDVGGVQQLELELWRQWMEVADSLSCEEPHRWRNVYYCFKMPEREAYVFILADGDANNDQIRADADGDGVANGDEDDQWLHRIYDELQRRYPNEKHGDWKSLFVTGKRHEIVLDSTVVDNIPPPPPAPQFLIQSLLLQAISDHFYRFEIERSCVIHFASSSILV